MNDYRSPSWDGRALRIGIILAILTLLIVILIFNYAKKDIKAGEPTINENVEVSTTEEEVTTEIKKEEVTTEDLSIEFHYPLDVEARREAVRRQKWIDEELYLPDSVRRQKREIEEAKAQEEPESDYYGYFELTAYTWTGNPCADGVYPSSGYTAACNDPGLWHKWVYIEGYGTYYIHDTGGMASNVIDIYMDSYDSCIQFGRRTANVYIVN